jgi:hypothetical protein
METKISKAKTGTGSKRDQGVSPAGQGGLPKVGSDVRHEDERVQDSFAQQR